MLKMESVLSTIPATSDIRRYKKGRIESEDVLEIRGYFSLKSDLL